MLALNKDKLRTKARQWHDGYHCINDLDADDAYKIIIGDELYLDVCRICYIDLISTNLAFSFGTKVRIQNGEIRMCVFVRPSDIYIIDFVSTIPFLATCAAACYSRLMPGAA